MYRTNQIRSKQQQPNKGKCHRCRWRQKARWKTRKQGADDTTDRELTTTAAVHAGMHGAAVQAATTTTTGAETERT